MNFLSGSTWSGYCSAWLRSLFISSNSKLTKNFIQKERKWMWSQNKAIVQKKRKERSKSKFHETEGIRCFSELCYEQRLILSKTTQKIDIPNQGTSGSWFSNFFVIACRSWKNNEPPSSFLSREWKISSSLLLKINKQVWENGTLATS